MTKKQVSYLFSAYLLLVLLLSLLELQGLIHIPYYRQIVTVVTLLAALLFNYKLSKDYSRRKRILLDVLNGGIILLYLLSWTPAGQQWLSFPVFEIAFSFALLLLDFFAFVLEYPDK